MSFRPGGSRGGASQAPKGYIPGLGRGAAGFVTQSDIGPATGRPKSAADGVGGDEAAGAATSGTGSRAAELRAAKLAMQKMQKAQQQQQQSSSSFGEAPAGYVAGRGRGFGGSTKTDDDGPTGSSGPGMEGSLFSGKDEQQFDDDDDEADRIYNAIDERMSSKRRKHNNEGGDSSSNNNSSAIGDQFRDLKQKLADVTEDEWAAIPDVGDHSLRHKQKRRQDVFTPLT